MLKDLSPLHETYGIEDSFDVRIKEGSKIKLKVAVFKDAESMIDFHTSILSDGFQSLDPKCQAFVNNMQFNVMTFHQDETVDVRKEMDKNYFAFLGIVKEFANNPEVLSHECVHVGFAYAKRTGKVFDERALDLDEENVAYPAGIAFSRIVDHLYK